jgi:hypothetical protein
MEQNNEILSAVSLEIKYKPKMQRKNENLLTGNSLKNENIQWSITQP